MERRGGQPLLIHPETREPLDFVQSEIISPLGSKRLHQIFSLPSDTFDVEGDAFIADPKRTLLRIIRGETRHDKFLLIRTFFITPQDIPLFGPVVTATYKPPFHPEGIHLSMFKEINPLTQITIGDQEFHFRARFNYSKEGVLTGINTGQDITWKEDFAAYKQYGSEELDLFENDTDKEDFDDDGLEERWLYIRPQKPRLIIDRTVNPPQFSYYEDDDLEKKPRERGALPLGETYNPSGEEYTYVEYPEKNRGEIRIKRDTGVIKTISFPLAIGEEVFDQIRDQRSFTWVQFDWIKDFRVTFQEPDYKLE